ncbi:hypothetical protein Loak_1445 [Legionella oakridgensis]|nr:hypothetical protein Loak_1445 [Legionella oakridgensis]
MGFGMPSYYDALRFNPFIHGTSSQTLSMMKHTDFQLMPILAMLQNFKIAPMVGELAQGGFGIIGKDSNDNTLTGAPAFGRMQHDHYDLNRVIKNYTKYSNNTTLNACKENFKDLLKFAHKSAFTNLNLLMIYVARLRQFGVKISDVVSLEEISVLKERLDATVQFYYFILCIQKYIFIDVSEIERFKKENDLDGYFAVGDYIEHFFSFQNFLEKLRNTQFNMEEIYHSPSPENISKLLVFLKIQKGTQETVKRYPSGEDNFIAKCDYHFFIHEKHEPTNKVRYEKIGGYLFTNNSSYSFAHYLEEYYRSCSAQDHEDTLAVLPDFEAFHGEVLPYINALKDRIQLCKALLDAPDDAFVPYDGNDALITKPFPIIYVTEANTIEAFHAEYRSRLPLKLGKEIVLVTTDNKENQKRLRDYLQTNNVGPVEVLLFDDLYTLRSTPDANYFDAFAHDDLIKAFELAKKQHCVTQFSKLYRALSELNEKRYRFKSTNTEIYEKLNELFTDLQQSILTPDKSRINFRGIQEALQRNKQENYTLYATHRGILGTIDRLLTILASLVVFYPITYLVQKSRKSMHTFFATDTEKKVDNALLTVEEITNELTTVSSQF